MKTTFSNGYLGSCDDEERSEMRYVMRIAELANHQVFERTWRFFGSMLVSVSLHPHPGASLWRGQWASWGGRALTARPLCNPHVARSV